MRLRRGSYYYIIGVLLMLLSGGAGAASVLLGIRYKEDLPFHNDLLSDYGNELVSSRVLLWVTGIFSTFAVLFAGYIFFTALKKNNIALPLRTLGVRMLLFSVVFTVLLILEHGRYGTLADVVGRYLHIPPIAALGVVLIALSLGKKNSRMPAVFFGAMSGYAAFAGMGFEKLFTNDIVGLSDTALRGYLSLFLFSLSLALFFSGICFCVGSCERKNGRTKRFEFAEE